MTGRIDRRTLLAAGSAAPVALCASSAHSAAPTGRPDLTLRQTAGDWQWCSWTHDGECWRPIRGAVRDDDAGGIGVIGPLPAQDRPEMLAILGETMPGRSVRFTR